MPLFNTHHKPAHQILVEKEPFGELSYLLVSRAEADLIKKELPAHKVKHLWLIDDQGEYLIPLSEGQEDIRPSLESGLVQIAAFNGDITTMEKHKEATEAWLLTETALKKRLVTMKAQNEELQKIAVSRSALLNCYYAPPAPKEKIVVRKITVTAAPPPPNLSAIGTAALAPGAAAAAARRTERVVEPPRAPEPPPPLPPPPPLAPPKTLAFRIGYGILSIFSLPFALFGLLFTLPFTRRSLQDFWQWFIRPFTP